ncbi:MULTISPECIES: hypothetical protein [Streptomyces violaceusniger group]|uniref:SPOR domain-containing protein n=3 Tax=Streptomyces violaceusniger group TaxID=2839105 RepID=A0A0A0NHQ1_STRRN|nr:MULTISPECIES: hypothetical protein [Streptomyces violaceusniger group]AGP53890.1 hypothetical protein M271_11455 [Streptomyces rapamycinicus NRRL 5491]MBB4781380.1 hypothetical protein [Streptomyces rapamycinicus]MBP2061320.1 hypothetical protein [Streptomyces iranensis]RLV73975.1 hypothetical protein D3C57_132155 [Streptomyces rapamycinicus NRRL 5491]UTO62002.1 hypothetical protein LJB45_06495 [Streptomyces rapamycinicus]
MKFRKLAVTLTAGAAFAMAGASAAQATPWQFVGSFPTKAACEKKAQKMHKAGKIDDHYCSPSRRGYDLGVHFR